MRPEVRALFKQLLYMGREYPAESGGYTKFSAALKAAFRKTPASTLRELQAALEKGEYVVKGMLDSIAGSRQQQAAQADPVSAVYRAMASSLAALAWP